MLKQKKSSAGRSKKKSEKHISPPESVAKKSKHLMQANNDRFQKQNILIFFLLVAGTVLLYGADLRIGFFSVDDPGYITENPWIKKISAANLSHILTAPYFSNYSPVHLLSYMIDYAVAGENAFAFHLSSNIWAGIVAGFVFLTAVALTQNRFIAIAASVLFIVHPVHVEAVAWISSRKDLIAAAFALPSLLAYLEYRKGGNRAGWWYALSLFLFLLATAGKLSVATFPAVFFLHDIFIEKRNFLRAIPDKLPYLAIAVAFALAVASAQPVSGNRPDPFVYLASLANSVLLLTGFGSYVIYRIPPEPSGMIMEVVATLILLSILVVPFFLRRKMPVIALLIYWIILTYLPSQVLSFIHPVTDRYLFMPSVAAVILIVMGIVQLVKKFRVSNRIVSVAILLPIAITWLINTIRYLGEWRDPRSVWYGAMSKSRDADVYYNLGANYLTFSALLGTAPRGTISENEKQKLAEKVWENDGRLPKLLEEWRSGIKAGPNELAFQNQLRQVTEDAFSNALLTKGSRVMPHLYLRFGVLYLDQGELDKAKQRFLEALDEIGKYTVQDVGQELLVATYNNLGIVEERKQNFGDALSWYKKAESTQDKLGKILVPGISANIARVGSKSGVMNDGGSINQVTDPQTAYNLALYYINLANKLASSAATDMEETKRAAEQVWKGNSNLQPLIAAWSSGQRGTAVEKSFVDDLKKLAWDALERAVSTRSAGYLNPNVYFRRGMLLAEKGNINSARKEFLDAIDQALKDSSVSVQQSTLVTSHDALGILAWRAGNYSEALRLFNKAEEEQKSFGGNWVVDLAVKKQQMEAMLRNKK